MESLSVTFFGGGGGLFLPCPMESLSVTFFGGGGGGGGEPAGNAEMLLLLCRTNSLGRSEGAVPVAL